MKQNVFPTFFFLNLKKNTRKQKTNKPNWTVEMITRNLLLLILQNASCKVLLIRQSSHSFEIYKF